MITYHCSIEQIYFFWTRQCSTLLATTAVLKQGCATALLFLNPRGIVDHYRRRDHMNRLVMLDSTSPLGTSVGFEPATIPLKDYFHIIEQTSAANCWTKARNEVTGGLGDQVKHEPTSILNCCTKARSGDTGGWEIKRNMSQQAFLTSTRNCCTKARYGDTGVNKRNIKTSFWNVSTIDVKLQ